MHFEADRIGPLPHFLRCTILIMKNKPKVRPLNKLEAYVMICCCLPHSIDDQETVARRECGESLLDLSDDVVRHLHVRLQHADIQPLMTR